MAVTYTWTISTVERNLSDGGVTRAHWNCEAVDDDYNALSYGSCGLEYDASSSDFIAYESLTEENVIGWVQKIVNKSETEAALASNINLQKNPSTGEGVPW
tara:strand:- start:89 stop:391 length:303 start_codon:yes stop_codon:yes gene_type:complete